MPRTKEAQQDWEIGCYGMSEADVRENLEPQAEFMGRDMLIMSMLSDVQSLIEFGQTERARTLINQTKYVLQEIPTNKMDDYLKQRESESK